MLSVEHVTKSFPTIFGLPSLLKYGGRPPRRVALNDVSLYVHGGELFGLLGPNGAGKTTLLKVMATLTIPDSGRIMLDGIDIAKDPMAAKSRVGLCTSEERSFYFRLTARANLQFFGSLDGLRGRTLRERIAEVSHFVGLESSLDRRFAEYSSGMRQRLTVARALLSDPKIVFLDEPTRAVDPVNAEKLRELIREQLVDRLGKTVVIATNVLDEAWSICDRVAVINEGRVAKVGAPRTLHAKPLNHYRIVLSELQDHVLDRVRSVGGCRDVKIERTDGSTIVTAMLNGSHRSLTDLLAALNGTTVREIRLLEPSPVEVFKAVTIGAGRG
ncbi:MAG: ABC transporter ATP-binding protein [Candidatus Eremiobacteraeota bacterium]|nr:ABC transporter ATP-binding protein [Candidatus Eremiobacteraeota bacterium]